MNSELLRVVEQEAEAERLRILEEARAQAQAIVSQAEARAAELRRDFQHRAQAEEAEALAKARSAADIEASAVVLMAKSQALDRIFDQALKAMKQLPAAENRQVLAALIREAAQQLGPGLKLRVSPREVGAASEIVGELKLQAEVVADEAVEGGVIASDASGWSMICNRFPDRLSQARPNLLSQISNLLWGKDA